MEDLDTLFKLPEAEIVRTLNNMQKAVLMSIERIEELEEEVKGLKAREVQNGNC